ncbi:hypothetical protein L1049_004382 [Liquidambar formosana]|uniref:Uncharacterized protein n=1 Tax=Liquidambar formosana TaxID=63359 RepID=A0AAP0RST2_LIQFO
MKHIVKIMTLLVAISAFWIGLLKTSVVPHSHTWLRIKLNCYVAIFFPATYLPYCIIGMLRSVNGWSRSDALSNLSSRGIAVAAVVDDGLPDDIPSGKAWAKECLKSSQK